MGRARELGAAVLGSTSPNPPVGAVVLAADGTVAGEGATAPPGGPHAEIRALAQAGERARGGTAVVTLEPCAHTGRTGPCADALLAAGVARVVVAVPEPTQLAVGGADRLRAAGGGGVLAGEQAEAETGARGGPPRAPAGSPASATPVPSSSGRPARPWTAGWPPPTGRAAGSPAS